MLGLAFVVLLFFGAGFGHELQVQANVQGIRCNECKRSFFDLQADDPLGCKPCYCSGVTVQCKCAKFFRDKIEFPLTIYGVERDFRLGDLDGKTVVNDGIMLLGNPGHLVYHTFDELPESTYYWYLPEQFAGDQVASYGGVLKFTVSYLKQPEGKLTTEPTAQLMGNGVSLLHRRPYDLIPGRQRSIEIPLIEDWWQLPDGRPVRREEMMLVLSLLENILVRATYGTHSLQSSLYEISMETSVQWNTRRGLVHGVELCACPREFEGPSCEKCARGYTRVKNGVFPLKCGWCKCNRHSRECDPYSGKCKNCNHNTAGDRCEKCAVGFYGNAKGGSSEDCKPCACPLTIPSNQFSRACVLEADGFPRCSSCQTGYTGRDCGKCARGYTGNPKTPGGKCIKIPEELLPKTTIWPERRRDSEGGEAIFYCLVEGRGPHRITWSRESGRSIPKKAVISSSNIRIPKVSEEDEDIYVCTVRNNYGMDTAQGELEVLPQPKDPIVVTVSPKTLNVPVGSLAKFVCSAKSDTSYKIVWNRGLSRPLPLGSFDDKGVLMIPDARKLHTGSYTCSVSNEFSRDQGSVQLRVGALIKPQVSITPRYLTVDEGDVVQFRCSATGFPAPSLQWLGGPGGTLPAEAILSNENGVLRIFRAKKSHEGEYFCAASNTAGIATLRTVLYVRAPGSVPVVKVGPASLKVIEGEEAVFKCIASGEPKPNIRWTRLRGSFPESSVAVKGVLRIYPAVLGDGGTYICTAANRFGAVATSVTLEVEKDLSVAPTAAVTPSEQTIEEGKGTRLVCEVTGKPEPVVEWNRVGGVLNDNHLIKGNILMIANITAADEGVYVCIAENQKGVEQATAVISVKEHVMPKIEIMPATKMTVTGGETVIFRCIIMGGVPEPSLEWSADNNKELLGSNTTQTKDNGVLMISPASGQHEGRYVCKATNVVGTVTATAQLTVLGEPKVSVSPSSPHSTPVGSQVTFECAATGDPTPSVQWILPAKRLSRSSPQLVEVAPGRVNLVIEQVTFEDQGDYKCVATNIVGGVQESISLVVSIVNKPPQVAARPAEHVAVAGRDAVFTCNATGIPSPLIVWERPGSLMPSTAHVFSGVLTITALGSSESGVYRCTALNSEGSASASVRLDVVVPPKVKIEPPEVLIKRGLPFRLACISTPPAPITWSKINDTIRSDVTIDDSAIEVKKATVKHTGKYRCYAENQAGFSESFAIVAVFVAPEIAVSPLSLVMHLRTNASLQCNATGIPTPAIAWTRENGQLPKSHSVRNGELTITELAAVDQGRYTCTATNAAGFQRKTVSLTIEDIPSVTIIGGTTVRTVPVGGSMELECRGSGIPKPVIQWSRVLGPLPPGIVVDGGLLFINNARQSFGGAYRCQVTNRVGSVQSQVEIFVQAAPQVTIAPTKVQVKVGDSVEFTCFASGSPTPLVEWRRTNGSLPVNHTIQQGVLKIPYVHRKDAASYACRATNAEGTAEATAKLEIKVSTPRFNQKPVSYMAFPTLTNEPYNFTLEIFFNPEIFSGLLLYNDQFTNGSVGDFVALAMSDGFVEFRFDLGSGPAIIRSVRQLRLYQWHTVVISRDGLQGTLKVDNEALVSGVAKGTGLRLNLNQNMYIGDVPEINAVAKLAGFTRGFVGCVSVLAVNGKAINLGEPLDRVGLTDCEVCSAKPCRNGGTCREIGGQRGFVCDCRPGYSGITCHVIDKRCYPGACVTGRCINTRDSFKCLCPAGFTGEKCEQGVEVETPMFEDNSFMSFTGIQGGLLQLKISMKFKAKEAGDMLLLYNGQRSKPRQGDFVSIAIVDARVEFRFNLGLGAAVIRSENNVTVGQWHTVIAERYAREGSLSMDGGVAVKDESPCCTIGLNLALPLYVGGVEDFSKVSVKQLAVDRGLRGCISEVSIDDQAIDLVNSYLRLNNIVQCTGDVLPCQLRPCLHNGTCIPDGQTRFTCACAVGYTGKNCETTLVGPGRNKTCLNDGLPFPPSGRICSCPLGYGGERCGSAVTLGESASFTGDGYIEYPRAVLKRSPTRGEEIALKFKTNIREGVLLWQGQKPGAPKGDYMYLAIRNGYLEYSFDLGTGPAKLLSRRQVNDNKWHHVEIKRLRQAGSLLVDNDDLVRGNSKKGARSLNVAGSILLGGGENIADLTYRNFKTTFSGCVGGIYLDKRKLDIQEDATKGYNVLPCQTQPSGL